MVAADVFEGFRFGERCNRVGGQAPIGESFDPFADEVWGFFSQPVLFSFWQRAGLGVDGNERTQSGKGSACLMVAAERDFEPAFRGKLDGALKAFGPQLPQDIAIAFVMGKHWFIRSGVWQQASGDAVVVIHDKPQDSVGVIEVFKDGLMFAVARCAPDMRHPAAGWDHLRRNDDASEEAVQFFKQHRFFVLTPDLEQNLVQLVERALCRSGHAISLPKSPPNSMAAVRQCD